MVSTNRGIQISVLRTKVGILKWEVGHSLEKENTWVQVIQTGTTT